MKTTTIKLLEKEEVQGGIASQRMTGRLERERKREREQ